MEKLSTLKIWFVIAVKAVSPKLFLSIKPHIKDLQLGRVVIKDLQLGRVVIKDLQLGRVVIKHSGSFDTEKFSDQLANRVLN